MRFLPLLKANLVFWRLIDSSYVNKGITNFWWCTLNFFSFLTTHLRYSQSVDAINLKATNFVLINNGAWEDPFKAVGSRYWSYYFQLGRSRTIQTFQIPIITSQACDFAIIIDTKALFMSHTCTRARFQSNWQVHRERTEMFALAGRHSEWFIGDFNNTFFLVLWIRHSTNGYFA